MGFLISEASEVHFEEAEVNQKTTKRSLVLVFMLAPDCPSGINAVNPSSAAWCWFLCLPRIALMGSTELILKEKKRFQFLN